MINRSLSTIQVNQQLSNNKNLNVISDVDLVDFRNNKIPVLGWAAGEATVFDEPSQLFVDLYEFGKCSENTLVCNEPTKLNHTIEPFENYRVAETDYDN